MATSMLPEYSADPGGGSIAGLSLRQQCELLRHQFESERSSFISHWKDLNDYNCPRRARFYISDVNKGDKRNQKIVDSTAPKAVRTLQAGMMSGVSSPARAWFQLRTPDDDLNEQEDVKEWLYDVENRIHMVMARSNFYKQLSVLYGDIGVFGTGAMGIFEDEKTVIRCSDYPIGMFSCGNDARQQVRIFFRTFRLTVQQLVEKWGQIDPKTGKPDFMRGENTKIPGVVQNLWKQRFVAAWIDCVQVIQPNVAYAPDKFESKYKRFQQVYYVLGATNQGVDPNVQGVLEVAGFDEFPVIVARWERNSEDVYGTNCPGMVALGDVKEIQVWRKRMSQGLEIMIKPPMVADVNLRSSKTSIVPGDIVWGGVNAQGQMRFQPAYQVPFAQAMQPLQESIVDLRNSIKEDYYTDLFILFAHDEQAQPDTATEVAEKKEEKLLALGPMLENLDEDVFDPAIDRIFNIMNRKGLIPPAPAALQGQPLKVEYISIMHQAQKMAGIASVERFAGFVGQIAQVNPEVLDYVDDEELIRAHADAMGIPPKILRTPEAVAAIKDARQKAQQQQAAAEQAPQLAKAAKDGGVAPQEGSPIAQLMSKMNAKKTVGATQTPPAPVQ
jgi:hypothetical protein